MKKFHFIALYTIVFFSFLWFMLKVSYKFKLIFLINVIIFKEIYYDLNLKFLYNIIKPILF